MIIEKLNIIGTEATIENSNELTDLEFGGIKVYPKSDVAMQQWTIV